MTASDSSSDRLFQLAEQLSREFSLFPELSSDQAEAPIEGILPAAEIERKAAELQDLSIDEYIERCVAPSESAERMAAPAVVRAMAERIWDEVDNGPYYACTMLLPGSDRPIGLIAQNRAQQNGVWMPEHHDEAALALASFSRRSIPVVCLMDTPGAAADEAANRGNQAHAISRLIAEMCNLDVPSVGVVLGQGYSGGAIPLAASNLILSVRDGVFNTIQPKGLASIARRYNLSWQECAKYVGVSPYELVRQGIVDAVVDYVPGEKKRIGNLAAAILTGIRSIEARTCAFVAENEYILDHYRRSITRYLGPSSRLVDAIGEKALSLSQNPTEYTNVFGVAYRYLRYLGVRKRIHATTTAQYGRLARHETPEGQLSARSDRESRRAFFTWLQDPDPVVYEDTLNKAWKSFSDRRDALDQERGAIATFIFGEPRKNFEDARQNLTNALLRFLYNRWKGDSPGNLRALLQVLSRPDFARLLLVREDIRDAETFIENLRADRQETSALRSRFSHEGLKLFSRRAYRNRSGSALAPQLCSELNLLLAGPVLADVLEDNWPEDLAQQLRHVRRLQAGAADGATDAAELAYLQLRVNRQILEFWFPGLVRSPELEPPAPEPADRTVLDVLLDDDVREAFRSAGAQLLVFDALYDHVIANLYAVADSARDSQSLTEADLERFISGVLPPSETVESQPDPGAEATTDAAAAPTDTADGAAADSTGTDAETSEAQPVATPSTPTEAFLDWYEQFARGNAFAPFLRSVEEWKRGLSPHLADPLFVVITFIFDRLMPSYIASTRQGKRFDGRILPRNIGRRKDFWNRLAIAYRDLLIQHELDSDKRRQPLPPNAFIERYLRVFEELDGDLLSSDPVRFPGFRQSIDKALREGKTPCGVVTGIGGFLVDGQTRRMGVVISNVEFQAGAFDMAGALKFCRLLVRCADEGLPVVCFISSGGMQTKEGAAALFSMAAVNDRITRFVRDNDLPVIVFGFGDCTGGAQASFVTHPLVQTYYFAGTNMPFAGQIVVSSNLPSDATLSNYLSQTEGAMQGLVEHPFHADLNERLAAIDPEMPQPTESVEQVVARILAGDLEAGPTTIVRPQRELEKPAPGPVRRVLVHARGCTAVKLVRIAQREGLEVVLVASDPDMESPAADMLREQDRLVCIGGNTSDESYLNAHSVLQVAAIEQVDALHPGIGFLSENASFAELVEGHGLNFVGPTVAAMETMGNKSNAIATAQSAGVPVVPGSHGVLADADQAAEVADGVGYPVLIKAVHGGGGKGIQRVDRRADIHELFDQVAMEARAAFGDGDVYIEKCVTSLRHIEVQVLADTHGNVKVIGLRDCSVQRSKQKVVEESDSTLLPPELRAQALAHAEALTRKIGYRGAGTVEFIFDLANQAIYFMEMNTRLQVEHPVTEWTSGVDLVAQQFRIASGESIADLEIGAEGFAIEVRITAERLVLQGDSVRFQPNPGIVRDCEFPLGPDVEVISAVGPGKTIPPFYDSLIAQLIVHAADREQCIERLLQVLRQTRITGVCTNLELLQAILEDGIFRSGDYDTGFMDAFWDRVDLQQLLERSQARAELADAGIDRTAIEIEASGELKVLAPGTGVFYLTPSPSEPEYVSVGDQVAIDQTLCQLEAMKIFTPLTLASFNSSQGELYPADTRYEISRINVNTGQQVNAGDLLFIIRPVIEDD